MDYRQQILIEMDEAAHKAWESLAGYKFIMFGYHASRWVNLRRLLGERQPNPFTPIVKTAQNIIHEWNS